MLRTINPSSITPNIYFSGRKDKQREAPAAEVKDAWTDSGWAQKADQKTKDTWNDPIWSDEEHRTPPSRSKPSTVAEAVPSKSPSQPAGDKNLPESGWTTVQSKPRTSRTNPPSQSNSRPQDSRSKPSSRPQGRNNQASGPQDRRSYQESPSHHQNITLRSKPSTNSISTIGSLNSQLAVPNLDRDFKLRSSWQALKARGIDSMAAIKKVVKSPATLPSETRDELHQLARQLKKLPSEYHQYTTAIFKSNIKNRPGAKTAQERNAYKKSLDLLELAKIAHDEGDFKKADKYLAKAVTLKPNNGMAWLKRASYYTEQGKVDEARKIYDRLISSSDTNSITLADTYRTLAHLEPTGSQAQKNYLRESLDHAEQSKSALTQADTLLTLSHLSSGPERITYGKQTLKAAKQIPDPEKARRFQALAHISLGNDPSDSKDSRIARYSQALSLNSEMVYPDPTVAVRANIGLANVYGAHKDNEAAAFYVTEAKPIAEANPQKIQLLQAVREAEERIQRFI